MDEVLEIRCPKLGHQVSIRYCLVENRNLPCARTIGCWQPYFPVETYLRRKLTAEQWDQCFTQGPPPKMHTLLELIDQAKARQPDRDRTKETENINETRRKSSSPP